MIFLDIYGKKTIIYLEKHLLGGEIYENKTEFSP